MATTTVNTPGKGPIWGGRRMWRLCAFALIVPFLLLSCKDNTPELTTGPATTTESLATIQQLTPPAFSWETPRAPSIAAQFLSINGNGGYPFTFRYWNNQITYDGVDCSNPIIRPYGCMIGDEPTLKTHYQGINRVLAPDGTSYLYLTRNGNPITIGTDHPGEILVVKMDDRNKIGDAFGIDPLNDIFGIQQPRPNDYTVLSRHLNGIDFEWGDWTQFINWKHVASGQQAGNRLFLPLEKTCNYEPANDKCGGGEEKRGAILVLKLADDGTPATNPDFDPSITPQHPKVDCQIDYYWDQTLNDHRALPTLGTLAVTKMGGDYILAHTTGGGYKQETALTFYKVPQADLCKLSPWPDNPDIIAPVINKIHDWNANLLQSDDTEHFGVDGWREDQSCAACDFDWQMINFLYDTNGDLYLIATDKSNVSDIDVRNDFARLYKVTYDATGNRFSVKYIAEKHFYLNSTTYFGGNISVDMGSFDAVGGAYVTPEGRLVVYSGSHDNDLSEFIFGPGATCNGSDLCKGVGLGEFASNYFHPPVITPPMAQTSDEGSTTLFQLGSFTDAVLDNQAWDVTVDWGDGSESTFTAVPGDLSPLQHQYTDGPATHTASIAITDSDGYTGHGSFDITVNNVAPQVTIDSISTDVFPGKAVTLDGSFVDPGSLDTHNAMVDWGDGSGFEPVTINAAVNTVSGEHVYTMTGTYTVTLAVTDNDGGEGRDSASTAVFTPIEGLMTTCTALGVIASDTSLDPKAVHHLDKAIGHICGNKGGLAMNGAMDMLEKGNLNAALVKLVLAVKELMLAEAADTALDLQSNKDLLVSTAKYICEEMINHAEKGAKDQYQHDKIKHARDLRDDGDRYMREHSHDKAADCYNRAAQEVQDIK